MGQGKFSHFKKVSVYAKLHDTTADAIYLKVTLGFMKLEWIGGTPFVDTLKYPTPPASKPKQIPIKKKKKR